MTVSRRLRYEILRRDEHVCRYCGATAPEVKLTVDHVTPIALGGTDDPSNLVAACADCNAGKTSSAPDQSTVAQVAADALRWATAMRRAAALQAEQHEQRRTFTAAFDEHWNTWTYSDGTTTPRPNGWETSVSRWFELGLTIEDARYLIDDVLPRRIPDSRMWRYFCGACWRFLEQRQEIARELLDTDGES